VGPPPGNVTTRTGTPAAGVDRASPTSLSRPIDIEAITRGRGRRQGGTYPWAANERVAAWRGTLAAGLDGASPTSLSWLAEVETGHQKQAPSARRNVPVGRRGAVSWPATGRKRPASAEPG